MRSLFKAYKNTTKRKTLDFTSNNTECYNKPFSLDKLSESLKYSLDTAVCPDQIYYQILKHLPNRAREDFTSATF